jgi:BirA family biotin operon repressor/biotin-[acetyl-CoA-carboxylase] ligase
METLLNSPAAARATSTRTCGRWRLCEFEELGSTNALAAQLPAWTAIRADVQSAGRGRIAARRWISDPGGLWLSMVVPCTGARAKWAILPLAAGWAVVSALREFGVHGARLRWPNDILIGRRKLAGILVERHRDDTAVVGVGLNVFNAPEECDETLAGGTARLADLVPGAYDLDAVTRRVLHAVHRVHIELLDRGFRRIADELNASWDTARRVRVTLAGRGHVLDGEFVGVDQQGRLRIHTARAGVAVFDATEVALLRELE